MLILALVLLIVLDSHLGRALEGWLEWRCLAAYIEGKTERLASEPRRLGDEGRFRSRLFLEGRGEQPRR
ncbi:MAG TPA: hypothetical protein DIU18_04555 [Gemmatimonadetes bacterium]|nr:hypothetical protein [Gemmatimonadota bacterium]